MTAATSKFMIKRKTALYAILIVVIFTLTASAPFSPLQTVYTITAQNNAGDVYTAVNDTGRTLTFSLADVDGFIFGVGQRVTVTTLAGRLDVLAY